MLPTGWLEQFSWNIYLSPLTFDPPVSEKAHYLGHSSMLSDSSSWRPTSATDRRGRSMRTAATH